MVAGELVLSRVLDSTRAIALAAIPGEKVRDVENDSRDQVEHGGVLTNREDEGCERDPEEHIRSRKPIERPIVHRTTIGRNLSYLERNFDALPTDT